MPTGVYQRKKRGPMSQEQKDKISETKKKNPTRYWLGKKRDGSSWVGKKASDEAREKMRLAKLGKPTWSKGLNGIKTGVSGEKHYNWKGGSPNCVDCSSQLKNRNAKRCLDCYKKTNPHKGEKNTNWKNGVSKINKTERQLFMETIEYKNWRKAVFERDDYTCVECHQRGDKLNADHIKPYLLYPELRLDVNNGRTLCVPCHKEIGWSLFKEKNPRKNVIISSI